MVPNQHGTYYYHVHFDNSNDYNDNDDIHFLLELYFGDVFMCEDRPGERARTCAVHTQMEDGSQEKLSAAPPYFCPTVYPSSTPPHAHTRLYPFTSQRTRLYFIHSFLPSFLLVFLPPLLSHPFGGHAKSGRSR
jgi:hypothetical protein